MELAIELSPEAEQDLHNHYLFYEDKMVGLGERFLSNFEQHLQIISCYPAMRIRYANIRCVPMHGLLMYYYCLEQMRAIGLLQSCEIMRVGLPNRISFLDLKKSVLWILLLF